MIIKALHSVLCNVNTVQKCPQSLMDAIFLGIWTDCVHACLLFGAMAKYTCCGMCGIFITDFHKIRIQGNVEWQENVGQVLNWWGLVLHVEASIDTALTPCTSCSAWPCFYLKRLVVASVDPPGSMFLIVVSMFDNAKFSHGSESWRNASLLQRRCPLAAPCLWPHTIRVAPHNGEHIIYLVVQAELL